MSGFPSRMGRLALGPLTLRARRPTKSVDQELDPKVAELLFWQVAGLGFTAALAGCTVIGGTETVIAAWAAWRPDAQSEAVPIVERTSAGVYTVTYGGSYPDETSEEIPTAFRAAKVTPQGVVFMRSAQSVDPDGRTIHVRLWDAAGAATDGTFLLEVL